MKLVYETTPLFIFSLLYMTTTIGDVNNKMLSYHRETALQGALVLATSGRVEQRDNILRSIFNYCHIIGLRSYRIR